MIVRILSDVGIARPLDQQSVLVTISGEVARPGRYYFRPGTRLADVVAQAGGLTSQAFPYASVVTRESVKAQQRLSFDRAIKDMEFQLTAQPVVSANRAQLAQPGNLALVHSIVDQLRAREPSGRLVFDLPVTASTLPGDVIVENNDTVYVPPRPVTVGVFGAVPSPASLRVPRGQLDRRLHPLGRRRAVARRQGRDLRGARQRHRAVERQEGAAGAGTAGRPGLCADRRQSRRVLGAAARHYRQSVRRAGRRRVDQGARGMSLIARTTGLVRDARSRRLGYAMLALLLAALCVLPRPTSPGRRWSRRTATASGSDR